MKIKTYKEDSGVRLTGNPPPVYIQSGFTRHFRRAIFLFCRISGFPASCRISAQAAFTALQGQKMRPASDPENAPVFP